jgi:AbrB family looped-hinge helix DNA binding protein
MPKAAVPKTAKTISAKITSKGQITIPREIRRSLGVDAGDRLLFEQHGSEVRVTPMRGENESPFEKWRGIGNFGIGQGRKAVIRAVRELRGR